LVIAQRLVRKICKYCIKSYNLDKKALESLSNQLNVKEFNKLLTVFYQGNGCKKCGETGYKGRLGIYEILEVTEEIKKLIMAKASTSEIKKLAQKEGMTLMLEDGLVKAKNGITTIEEVLRVTRE
jgi:type IV pilus assembly protein PilB